MDWKTLLRWQYSQSNLNIQYNPYQNHNELFFRSGKADHDIHIVAQHCELANCQ